MLNVWTDFGFRVTLNSKLIPKSLNINEFYAPTHTYDILYKSRQSTRFTKSLDSHKAQDPQG